MSDRNRGHCVRILLLSGFVLALFVGLMARLVLIQGVGGAHYRRLAERQYHVSVPLTVRRGTIMDRVGRELAVSTQVPSIFANPRLIPDKPATATALAKLLDVDRAELLERLTRRPATSCVRPVLTEHEVGELRESGLLTWPGRPLVLVARPEGGHALHVRPAVVEDAKALAKELAPVLHRDWRDVRPDLEGFAHFVWVRRKVSGELRRLVQARVAEERRRRALHVAGERRRWREELELPEEQRRPMAPPPTPVYAGIGIAPEHRREYAHGGVAPQLVGFVGIDENGLEGLELVLDETLGGRPGKLVFQRDASGGYISATGLPRRPPVPGADVELSIDAVIQSYAEAALDEAVALWAPASASAVVLDPQTGDVLACACRPSFDVNHLERYEPAELKKLARARYVVDWQEPGSIMKAFVLSAAFTERLVTERTVVFCENGVWRIGPRRFHDHHAYGQLTVEEVIVKSSNIGAAKLGTRLGSERLHRYLSLFGFGRPTGCPLRGENPGMLRPTRQWRPFYSLPSISIGQEVCVNMLQMALAYGAIANGGELMRPRFVRRVLRADGTETENPVQVVHRAIPSQVARRVRRVLCRVVEEGTGQRAKLELYSVGGKTGTAQKAIGRSFSHNKLTCSFVAMAPIEHPRVVVMVSVDEPTKRTGGRHYGGTVAAPVVGQIINQTLAYLGVPPDKPQILARLGLTGEHERTN